MTKAVEKQNKPPANNKVIRKTLKLWFWSILHFGRWYMPNIPEIKPDELYQKLLPKQSAKSIMLIDIREKYEVKKDGCIEGTTFFPYFNFPSYIHKIPRDSEMEIVTICPGGGASLVLAEILLAEGFNNVKSLKGGFKGYRKKKFPTIKPSSDQELDSLFINKEEGLDEYLLDKKSLDNEKVKISQYIDARNLSCPGPVLALSKAIKTDTVKLGEVLEILTTDPGSLRDIPAWVVNTKQELISYNEVENKNYRFIIKRII